MEAQSRTVLLGIVLSEARIRLSCGRRGGEREDGKEHECDAVDHQIKSAVAQNYTCRKKEVSVSTLWREWSRARAAERERERRAAGFH